MGGFVGPLYEKTALIVLKWSFVDTPRTQTLVRMILVVQQVVLGYMVYAARLPFELLLYTP